MKSRKAVVCFLKILEAFRLPRWEFELQTSKTTEEHVYVYNKCIYVDVLYVIYVYFVLIFKDTLSSHDCTLGALFLNLQYVLFFQRDPSSDPLQASQLLSLRCFRLHSSISKLEKKHALTSYEHLNSPTFVSFFFPCIPEQAQQLHWWLRGRPNLLHFGSSSPQ